MPEKHSEFEYKGKNINWYICSRSSSAFSNPQTTDYEVSTYYMKQMMVEEVDCLDIDIKGYQSNTYYPPKSKCYRDPTYMSCPNIGSSG
jgi:hypothetical protein